jgi:hypothetical protein
VKRDAFKVKTCAVCGKEFIPFLPLATVCGPVCAGRKVKAARKAEKADIKRRKEAIKTIPVLLREAQTAFNSWVRGRDHDQPCISCGAPPPDLSKLHGGRDAGHYRSVGSAPHLRFHEDNCNAQCVRCNQFASGRVVDYRIGLIARIGAARVEALESNNAVHKWSRDELIAIKTEYRAKLKALKEQA